MSVIEEQLRKRLEELLSRSGQIDRDLRLEEEPVSRDLVEQATDLENDEVLAALDQQTRIEIDEVRTALARVESGNYGLCSRCGEPIPPARLAAMPYTSVCVDDA